MDTRDQYLKYMTSLAERSQHIAHAANRRRFFLEIDYNKLLGGNEPNNLDWNMVLMGFETKDDNNRHGGRAEDVTCIFDILKQVPMNSSAEQLNVVLNQARLIGRRILDRMELECKDPCKAPVPPPEAMEPGTVTSFEVGPRFSEMYGYRFSLKCMMRIPKPQPPVTDDWLDVPPPPVP